MKWISVKEDMPENVQSVLIWVKFGDEPQIGFYKEKERIWYITQPESLEIVGAAYLRCDLDSRYEEVTHWMPLPKPPKQ